MKKIIRPAVREEAELICDVTGKPAVARLVMTFGYGSFRDMELLEVDLCAEAAEEVLKFDPAKIEPSGIAGKLQHKQVVPPGQW